MKWSEWVQAAIDVVLPACCPLCLDTLGKELCVTCRDCLEILPEACVWCGAAYGLATCQVCGHRGFPHIDSTRCAFAYTGIGRTLITRAKAKARPAAVRACALLMPQPLPDLHTDTVVVMVPPSPGRRPGPHLGTALARAVAMAAQRPLSACLVTTRTAAEQHRLGRSERQDNVRDLFICRGPAPRRVILVDDLITSGATATAAATALALAGSTHIQLLALARTQPQ